MPDAIIGCPKCGAQIELTEALAAPLVAEIRRKSEADAQQREKALLSREEALAKKTTDLQGQVARLELTLSERLTSEREKIAREQEAKAQSAVEVRLKELQASLVEKDRKLQAAQAAELTVRQAREKLEEQQREWELQKQRDMDAERGRVREAARNELLEQTRLKDAEKDKVINDLKGRIDELQRKADQGSQQLRGEVAELALEELLRAKFPRDTIEPVAKGQFGGDCVQRVVNATGQACGAILWESKRTKTWQDGWLPKLRDDQRAARAEIAAICTSTLPKGVERFDCIDGVWICEPICAAPLAMALRHSLIEAASSRVASEGQHTKMEQVYQYLCGPQFRQRVEAIVESFTTMMQDLEAERRVITKQWAKREKQIERVIEKTVGMYGDLQGIAGRALPRIESLELDSLSGASIAPRAALPSGEALD